MIHGCNPPDVYKRQVHDDASTDGTATIIREYAEKYPDIIKPIYETENQYSKRDDSLTRIIDVYKRQRIHSLLFFYMKSLWLFPNRRVWMLLLGQILSLIHICLFLNIDSPFHKSA